jgi:hypothetical protein
MVLNFTGSGVQSCAKAAGLADPRDHGLKAVQDDAIEKMIC